MENAWEETIAYVGWEPLGMQLLWHLPSSFETILSFLQYLLELEALDP
jgi:hypothetical protein